MARSDTPFDHVDFGDAVRAAGLGQCQYVSRYVDGRHGRENLGHDLRIGGDPRDYHCLTIHKDDVQTFIDRVNAVQAQRGFGD